MKKAFAYGARHFLFRYVYNGENFILYVALANCKFADSDCHGTFLQGETHCGFGIWKQKETILDETHWSYVIQHPQDLHSFKLLSFLFSPQHALSVKVSETRIMHIIH